jgi:hypothetical protein
MENMNESSALYNTAKFKEAIAEQVRSAISEDVVLQVVSSDLFEFHLETGIPSRADRKISPFFYCAPTSLGFASRLDRGPTAIDTAL